MADRVDTGGLTTALRLLGAAGAVAGGGDGQPDLFEAEDEGLPVQLPAARAEPGKAGRPRGSRNRSTDEWLRYLSARYQSPLVGLAETWSRSPEQLAEDLKLYKWHEGKPVLDAAGNHVLDTGTASAMQQQARIAALPYWHRKQPQAIEVEQKQRGIVLIGDLDVSDISAGDDLALPLPPIVADQGVSSELQPEVGQAKVGQPELHSHFNGVGPDDH